MALMLGYYGPVELAVGPGCSRLVQASSVFVQGIKVSSSTLRGACSERHYTEFSCSLNKPGGKQKFV